MQVHASRRSRLAATMRAQGGGVAIVFTAPETATDPLTRLAAEEARCTRSGRIAMWVMALAGVALVALLAFGQG